MKSFSLLWCPFTLLHTTSFMYYTLLCVGYCFTCCKIHKDEQKTSPPVISNTSEESHRGKWSKTRKHEVYLAKIYIWSSECHRAILLFYFSFGCTLQHVGILVLQPGIRSPAVEVWSLNHWTTREVPNTWPSFSLAWGSASFCKGPGGQWFWLCRPYGLCSNYPTLPCGVKAATDIHKSTCGCVQSKRICEHQRQARFGQWSSNHAV